MCPSSAPPGVDATALLDVLPEGVLVLDLFGEVLYANPAAGALTGRAAEDLVGRGLGDIFEVETAAGLMGLLWSGFSGAAGWDVRLVDQRRVALSVARPNDQLILLSLRDVTHAHRLEEALHHARRHASMGRLTAALAQDINGPLSIIQGRLDLLATMAEGKAEPVERHTRVLREHTRRIGALVRNLQSFAARRAPRRDRVSLRAVAQEARAHCGKRLDKVLLRVDLNPEDLHHDADHELLVQLLSALLQLGADASPPGQELRVEARHDERGALRISVHDQSDGIPAAVLRELRSPYADERGVDPGVGLDLALAWAIAQDHGGWLQAENRPGRGASVHVRIPGPAASAPPPTPSGAATRILVVDDDQLLRETVSWMLEGEGYAIVGLPSAEDALVQLQRERFDVLLADIRLPGMDGETFVDRVEREWPDLARRAVLTSGLLHLPRRPNLYLQKPFDRAQLLDTLMAARAQR